MSNIKKSILWRVAICFAAVSLFAFWVSFQMFKIQVAEGDKWLKQSDSLTIISQDISPARGNIYSDDGSLLATSMPIYEVAFDPTVVDKDTFYTYVSSLAKGLSEIFPDVDPSYYKRTFTQARTNNRRYILIKRNANYNQLKAIKALPIFRLGRYRGGLVSDLTTKRFRPAGMLAFRTIGYYTKDNPGVGLERAYSEDLGGEKGKRLVQKISGGYRPINDENLIEPQNGRDVYTTINIDFQEIAHIALSKAIIKHNADHGCVVVMEVKTGKIKAVANLKNREDKPPVESYNYAIGESYEPGSVFKVFSAMAALEDKILGPNDSLNVYNGVREYFGKPMKDSDPGARKFATFKTGFSKSSNVFFSSMIFDNYYKKPAEFIGHLKRLDLHESTGIEILGEPEPFLNQPSSSTWSNLTLPWLAIGYENKHTPLQILTAYNAIINDGLLVKPQIVNEITDAGIVVKDLDTELESKRICSKETSTIIKDFAKETVEHGTAVNIRSSVVSMGGKTGTAQIASKEGYQTWKQYNATFVGHFPAEDPVYSVIVMINRPSAGVFYASYVAAPVFGEIAEKIYTINVKKEVDQADSSFYPRLVVGKYTDIQNIYKQVGLNLPQDANTSFIEFRSTNKSTKPRQSEPGAMPKVLGMGARDAMYLLELQGYKVVMKGNGHVVEQSPLTGVKVNKGSTVYLRLGS